VESFNGRLRDELLNGEIFTTLREAQIVIEGGYSIICTANATEALAAIKRGVAFDLLFTDVLMPGGMNGQQLAGEAAKLRRSLKVLFTSGYTENALTHNGKLEPGVLLLSKPYAQTDLARMVRKAISSKPNAHAEMRDLREG